MARKTGRRLAVLLLLFLIGCGAPGGGAPAAPPLSPLPPATLGPLSLTLVHSNDTWGYVDPCG